VAGLVVGFSGYGPPVSVQTIMFREAADLQRHRFDDANPSAEMDAALAASLQRGDHGAHAHSTKCPATISRVKQNE